MIPAFGQFDLGSINGSIMDQSNAQVQNATVEIRNAKTGAARTATTDANGNFNIPSLPTGEYEVRVVASGFKPISSTIVVSLGSPATFDGKLTIGNVDSTVVVVTGGETTLQTDSHEVGQVISEQQLTQLPANGRNILDLAVLGPGSQRGGDYNASMFQGSGAFFATLSNSVIIAGLPNTNTAFLQDGTENLKSSDTKCQHTFFG